MKSRKEELQNLLNQLQANINIVASLRTNILIKNADGYFKIGLHEIIYCESHNSSVVYFLTNKRKLFASVSLKQCEALLQHNNFYRVHQKHLVNIEHVIKYKPGKDGGELLLSDANHIKVARTRKDDFVKHLYAHTVNEQNNHFTS